MIFHPPRFNFLKDVTCSVLLKVGIHLEQSNFVNPFKLKVLGMIQGVMPRGLGALALGWRITLASKLLILEMRYIISFLSKKLVGKSSCQWSNGLKIFTTAKLLLHYQVNLQRHVAMSRTLPPCFFCLTCLYYFYFFYQIKL